MDSRKYNRSRGHNMGSSNKRVPPYLVLVLLAIGAAALSVGILHKMRERRVLTVLLQERDQQLLSLQMLLEENLYPDYLIDDFNMRNGDWQDTWELDGPCTASIGGLC
ncbi:hypothetical protein PR202_gb14219 [Eleusine coracana subsp. coracana]|uniref:Uncharacterized protein n=1 Tax=Eleusine coracana subsp. coracana TaxID=191504 RepID=A0AAV5ETY9_ELECO|nr:hypothetical protein PR202_gb14219 [Eleusine coracana subsp. coracana]